MAARDRRDRGPLFWYLRRRPASVASEVDEELATHLQMRVEELMAHGLRADEARREALRQFGDIEFTRQYCRTEDLRKETHVQRGLFVEELVHDLRISLRGLIRVPMLTLTILMTVGLGIGATTVIFSAVDAALLRQLPYADPGRLVRIYTDTPPFKFPFSVADYQTLEAQQTRFTQVAGYQNRSMAYSDGVSAELLRGRVVSWTYFDVLGLKPLLGRTFTAADSQPGNPLAVIVSYSFWQQRLGGRRDAPGQTIRLDGNDYVVAGVLPQTVGPLEQRQDFFAAERWGKPPRKGPFFITALGRLRNETERPRAADEMRAINRRMFPLWKVSYQDDKATWSLMDLREFVVGDVGTIAGLSLAAVALVWLIACANASNLLIARVTSRRRELSVRAALGASRGRVVRYLLAESALLAAGASAIGFALAWAGIRLVRVAGADYLPRIQEIALGGPSLALMAAMAVGSVLLFGLIPAVHGTGGSVDESLRSATRSATGSPTVRRLRRLLVGSQFAIATPLLVVAGLLLVSLSALQRVDLGFDSRNLLTGSIRLPPAGYQQPGSVQAFWDELQRRLQAVPGVSGVAFADGRPPNEVNNFNNFDLEDFPAGPGQSQPVSPWLAVTPDFFQVMGLSLLQGRLIDQRDAQRPNLEAVVVDRAWARRFFPNGGALGKRFKEGGCTTCPWTEVVGIVSEVKYVGLDKPDEGTVYAPWSGSFSRFLVVRTTAAPASVLPAIQRTIRELDAAAPLSSVATIDELVARSLQTPRSLSALIGGFAAVALTLSMIGIYGVMAYYVQQHAKDIGIRLALGAARWDVLRHVVGQGMTLVASGTVVGLLTAVVATRLMTSLLFGVGAIDPATFAGVFVVVLVVALLACAGPAARASTVQPATVLRNE